METMYLKLNKLNLIDKDDIVLYLSSQRDIIDKISFKRLQLKKKYRICVKSIKILIRFFKWVKFKNSFKDLISTSRNIPRDYINTETFLGDPIDYIPDKYFFTYQEDGYYYVFDLREFQQLIKYGKKNPYTNNEFPTHTITHVNRLLKKIKTYDLMIYIKKSVPSNSNESAKIASVFNKLSNSFVYPDIKKFIKFSTKFYLYYIQDLKTNNLLSDDIDIDKYENLVDLYSRSIRINPEDDESLKIQTKARNVVLDILLDLLDLEDSEKYTRALAISEQINYNYGGNFESDDSDDFSDTNSEDENEVPVVPITEPLTNINGNMIIHRNPLFQAAISNNTNNINNLVNETTSNFVDNILGIDTNINLPRPPNRPPPPPRPSPPPPRPNLPPPRPSPPPTPPSETQSSSVTLPRTPPLLQRMNAISDGSTLGLPPGINRRNLNTSSIVTPRINRVNYSSARRYNRRRATFTEFPPTTPPDTLNNISSLINQTQSYLDSYDNNQTNNVNLNLISQLSSQIEAEITNLENRHLNRNNNDDEIN